MKKSKSVVIIAKNTEVKDELQKLIDASSRFNVVHVFESYESALSSLSSPAPHIVLIVVDSLHLNAIDGIKHIKVLSPQTEIIVITEQENSRHVFACLTAGATGFLVKNTPRFSLIQALEDVTSGGAPLTAFVSRLLVESFHTQGSHDFSAREIDVLKLLSNGKSYKTIAQQLKISFSTVKFHIQNIYRKLHVNTKEEAITKVQAERIV